MAIGGGLFHRPTSAYSAKSPQQCSSYGPSRHIDMRTAAYNSVFLPTYAINAMNDDDCSPYRLHCRGCVRYEGNTAPLPKRVAVVSKYYIRRDIAGSRGGSLGWLVINIEVGAPTFTWYEFSSHHTHDHLQIMLHVDWSNILRYISVIDSDSLVLPTGFGIRRRYTTLNHHCLTTSGGDVLSSQTLPIRCDIIS